MTGDGKDRYGKQIISDLSQILTQLYGKGFDRGSIYRYIRFYKMHPKIVSTPWQQSHMLSWSYYRMLRTKVPEKVEREMKELRSPYQESWNLLKIL